MTEAERCGSAQDQHGVLLRQLRKLGLDASTPPDGPAWQKLLAKVTATYQGADRARYLSDRSTELASSEMQDLHDKVLAEKQQLRSVTDAIASGILGLDSEGIVVVVNPAALRLLDRSSDDTLGQPIDDVISAVEHSGGVPVALGSVIRRHLSQGEQWSFASGIVVSQSQARHVAMQLTPHHLHDTRGVATLLLVDVTADVIAEEERNRRVHLEAEVAERDDQLDLARRRAVGLLENVNDIIAVIDRHLQVTWASPALSRTLGYDAEDLPEDLASLVHPDDLLDIADGFARMAQQPSTRWTIDARIRNAAREYRWLEIVIENRLGHAELDGYVICARDIHERVQQIDLLETQAEILELISKGNPLGVVLDALARAFANANESAAAAALFVSGEHEALAVAGKDGGPTPPARVPLWRGLLDATEDDAAHAPDALPGGPAWAEHATRSAEYGLRPVHVESVSLPDGTSKALTVLYADADSAEPRVAVPDLLAHTVGLALVNDRHRLELERQASHDPLTGLPNRWQLEHLLNQLVSTEQRQRRSSAVLFVDLDDLKRVNDSLGHESGDIVLQVVAERLSKVVRGSDLLCRFGGDEFVVVCQDLDGDEDALWVAGRILRALREPIEVGDISPVVTASIGVAYSGADYDDAEQLIRDADAAMYEAKAAGRNRHVVFDGAMRSRVVHRLDVETRLRRALDAGEIVAHFQPQYRPGNGTIVAVEALARWDDPERGLLAPADWLEVAENSGLIVPVGEQILAQAFDLARQTDEQGDLAEPLRISVNVAAQQLRQPALVEHVLRNLERTSIDPERICLEITESSLADLTDPHGILAALKDLGVRISVDDWGTGYSSLEYLRRLPVDELKVDRAFISALDDPDGIRLVGGICQLGRALDLEIVAEGVETHGQLGHVRAFRFDLVQGFLLAHPMAGKDVVALVQCPKVNDASPTPIDHGREPALVTAP